MQRICVWALPGIGEIAPGADVAGVIATAVDATGEPLIDGDILVITSKIISKAEGRIIRAEDREAAITSETVRVVATRERTDGTSLRIVENRLGIVGAAAGVDASNTEAGTVLLLPIDPDDSARRIGAALRRRWNVRIGVVITDTLGRPWRGGQTDIAIGAAGVRVFDEMHGMRDSTGRELRVTRPCLADEIAGAGDLVKGKVNGTPVAVLRGLGHAVGELDLPGAATIVRTGEDDLFREGTAEAYRRGLADGSRGDRE
ncbi:coenzyme F420-0:L-glutamate ligase [Microbacterium sp.]|uniref:coenzyme F420-0:L-glutamate ligase n=1 Tax=Microbacterium sp. TaxID=51671 RepID=UPI002811D779|nr:coenzyme F420-0:L-glutamate ligase [Microbacterium sp.]